MYTYIGRTVCHVRVSLTNVGVRVVTDVMLVDPVELGKEEVIVAEECVNLAVCRQCKVVCIVE